MSSATFGDENDDCVSITAPSVDSENSATSGRKRKAYVSGSAFRAWNFQLMTKAALGDGTTAVENVKLLQEHLSTRTGHTRPRCVIGVAVFCDRSLFSQPPDSDGLVSIEVLGYI